ncbi:MAG: hypothetical protein ACC648_03510 [Thiohalobacterales bacterium]
MSRKLIFLWILLVAATARAELPGVLHWEVEQDLESTYKSVYKSLEENRFFVVFEPNIGTNLEGFAERWGDDYNRNGLSGIRSMVFCNAWYANAVSNVEPVLLSLCPLHITLFHREGTTSIVFTRPTHTGAGSKAGALLQELETDVSKAIEAGLRAVQQDWPQAGKGIRSPRGADPTATRGRSPAHR